MNGKGRGKLFRPFLLGGAEMKERIGVQTVIVWVVVLSIDQLFYFNGVYYLYWLEIKLSETIFLSASVFFLIRSKIIPMERISIVLKFQHDSKKSETLKMQTRFWICSALGGLLGGWYFSQPREVWSDQVFHWRSFQSSGMLAFFYLSLLFLHHFVTLMIVEKNAARKD